MKKENTYNNLIDCCIRLEEDPQIAGNIEEVFQRVLTDYFFREEADLSKSLDNFLMNLDPPPFLQNMSSILQTDVESLRTFVEGESANDSLAGRIYLSGAYLKSFYPHHTPKFSSLPGEVQTELMDKIKTKNRIIVEAFEKMASDRESDSNRKIVTLVALILKNIHIKTALPFNKLNRPAEDVIREVFLNCDDVFKAKQHQVADLNDDNKIKTLIKSFFIIKKFSDIAEISKLFKNELDRFRKRALRI